MDFFDQDDKTPLKTSTAPTSRTLKTIIYIPSFTSSLLYTYKYNTFCTLYIQSQGNNA